MARFRELRDRGYLFFCLIENGKDFDATDIDRWIDRSLEVSGLPGCSEILARARAAMVSLRRSAEPGPARDRLDELLAYGLAQFERFGLGVDRASYEGGDSMPPVKLNDGQFVPGGSAVRAGSFADPQAWEEEAERYENQLQEVVEACLL